MVIDASIALAIQTRSIFPVRDLGRALAHYQSLGFIVQHLDEHVAVALVERAGVVVHLVTQAGPGPTAPPAVTHLVVGDAHALAVEWSQSRVEGTTVFPAPTDDGWQEGIHYDPDDNLIRFRSLPGR